MVEPLTAMWIVAVIVFAVVEAVTANLLTVWFAAGALAALLANCLGAPLPLQITVFIVVSLLLFALIFPTAKKHLTSRKTATNADRVLGKEGVVTRTVNNTLGEGQVKVGGEIWTARSADGCVIEAQTLVRILSIEGVKLIVAVSEGGTN